MTDLEASGWVVSQTNEDVGRLAFRNAEQLVNRRAEDRPFDLADALYRLRTSTRSLSSLALPPVRSSRRRRSPRGILPGSPGAVW